MSSFGILVKKYISMRVFFRLPGLYYQKPGTGWCDIFLSWVIVIGDPTAAANPDHCVVSRRSILLPPRPWLPQHHLLLRLEQTVLHQG